MGMYGNIVNKIAGSSTGASALRMMQPLADQVTKRAGIGGAAGYLGGKARTSSGVRSQIYGTGARVANSVARHPMRAIGGTAAGAGLMASNRRRGSQNYPMY